MMGRWIAFVDTNLVETGLGDAAENFGSSNDGLPGIQTLATGCAIGSV